MKDNVERAAILLLGMGEQQASQVLKYLEQDQVEKIVTAMSALGSVNQQQVYTAVNQFLGDSTSQTGLGLNNSEYIRNTLIGAVGANKADSILDKTIMDGNAAFDVLKWQSATTIYDLLQREHPQLIAVIVTLLDGDKAAKVMKLFPEAVRSNIMNRIAKLGSLSPIALTTINEVLEKSTSQLTNYKEFPLGGAKKVADIVSHFDSEVEDQILESLSKLDEELTEQVHDFMFPFEKLAEIDPRSLQKLLREIPSEQLTLAVKAADESLKDLIFENMSTRAAEMIKDDLEAMGPTAMSKVVEAQKEIVATAQRMASEGLIVIGGTGTDKMV